jgi:hypothetical protein
MADPAEQINQLTQLVQTLREQVQNLSGQVATTNAAVNAANQQANQGQNQGNQNVTFALNPIKATTTLIDMTSKEGVKLYKLGLEKVHDVLFNGKSENVNFFRANVHRKGVDSGWYETGGNIFNIEDKSVTPTKTYDIVYKTQEAPLNVIERFANDNIVNKQTRAAQNNYMAVKSLFNSIDEDMMKRMMAENELHHAGYRSRATTFQIYYHEVRDPWTWTDQSAQGPIQGIT